MSEKKGLQWLVGLEKNSSATDGFFFINFKLSLVAVSSGDYRISYLSTRNVVSVENLTGLPPSTWVTLVTWMLQ